MGEIKRDPAISKDENGDEVACFDARHSLSDIARWILRNRTDAEELHRILGEALSDERSENPKQVTVRRIEYVPPSNECPAGNSKVILSDGSQLIMLTRLKHEKEPKAVEMIHLSAVVDANE